MSLFKNRKVDIIYLHRTKSNKIYYTYLSMKDKYFVKFPILTNFLLKKWYFNKKNNEFNSSNTMSVRMKRIFAIFCKPFFY